MNDKQQLAAIGDELHLTEEQARVLADMMPKTGDLQVLNDEPMCLAKRVEELEDQLKDATAQCVVMAGLLREAMPRIRPRIINYVLGRHDLVGAANKDDLTQRIDAALAGKLPDVWLSIETAPRDGRKALVYRPLAENSGDEPIAVKRLTGGRNNSCWDRTVPPGETPCNPTDGACHVTHWMPLPAAPSPDSAK